MPLPRPQRGLVISYSYLWHIEHRAGFDGGRKVRPCVIVLALDNQPGGSTLVRVAPITHSQPRDATHALELPVSVKRHLGLDDQRSWVILDEVNEFRWPGFDLRPIAGSPDRFAFGFIPPRLFDQLMAKLRAVWMAGEGKATARD